MYAVSATKITIDIETNAKPKKLIQKLDERFRKEVSKANTILLDDKRNRGEY